MREGKTLTPTLARSREREREVRFAGYAAIFERADRGGDVVRRGAFARAVARAREVPLLWQHRSDRVVGRVEMLAEDRRGLRVIARVSGEAARLVKNGAGLSFGYRVREARHGARRELLDVDLVEVSLVAQPMQRLARVHAVERSR